MVLAWKISLTIIISHTYKLKIIIYENDGVCPSVKNLSNECYPVFWSVFGWTIILLKLKNVE